jgi:iron complex outermembrane receptor protein
MQAIEAGFTYHSPLFTIQSTLWHHHGKNMIDWIMDTSKGEEAVWQSVNHTKINSLGIEAAATMNFLEIIPTQHFLKNVRISYSYIDQNKDQKANIVSQYALEYLRHKLVGIAQLQLMKRLSLSLDFRWQDRVGSYTDFDGRPNDYEPYALLDARMTYLQDKWKVYIEANNVFDKKYHDYGLVEQPGRWIIAGFNISI